MIYGATALTGGATGALDAIDGAILVDQDMCITTAAGVTYTHWLDDDSGAAESSPGVIAPYSNPGTKRWIVASIYSAAVPKFAVISGTRAMDAASGDVSYTGAGFLPKAVQVIGHAPVGANAFNVHSSGFTASPGGGKCVSGSHNAQLTLGNTLVNVIEDTTIKLQSAVLKTFDADGCTLTWTRTGATAAGTFSFIMIFHG